MVFLFDGGPACDSRPAACQPSPQGPPNAELAAQTLVELFSQCCGEIACSCNSMCQTTEVVFDGDGCAVEMRVNGEMTTPLADRLVEHLNTERWPCAAGKTVVHMALCPPC